MLCVPIISGPMASCSVRGCDRDVFRGIDPFGEFGANSLCNGCMRKRRRLHAAERAAVVDGEDGPPAAAVDGREAEAEAEEVVAAAAVAVAVPQLLFWL